MGSREWVNILTRFYRQWASTYAETFLPDIFKPLRERKA